MENKIRMIITDMDGSLLNNEGKMTEYSSDILNRCIQNGIIVVFATARPLRGVEIFYDSIMPDAVICYNGATVYVNEKKIYQCGIRTKIAKRLIKDIMEKFPNAKLAIDANNQLYTNFDASTLWGDIDFKKMDIETLPKTKIDKIIIKFGSIDETNGLIRYLPRHLYLEISERGLGIIMNRGATKWNAIEELLKYYNIGQRNTIAFGDDYNDLEMVKYCGTGVAMKNGIDEIKAVAKYVCEVNSENGIAKWINENILMGARYGKY